MLLGYGEPKDKCSSVLLSSILCILFCFYSIRALLLGLASNINLKDVSLDLSCCEVRIPSSSIFSHVFFLLRSFCSLQSFPQNQAKGANGKEEEIHMH